MKGGAGLHVISVNDVTKSNITPQLWKDDDVIHTIHTAEHTGVS